MEHTRPLLRLSMARLTKMESSSSLAMSSRPPRTSATIEKKSPVSSSKPFPIWDTTRPPRASARTVVMS